MFRVYNIPFLLRDWADDFEAPLRHLGFLDVARLKLPNLISELIYSYDPMKRCGYVQQIRVNVDRESFLTAVSLHPIAESKDLPPGVHLSTVTHAAEQFIKMCLLRPSTRDNMLRIVSPAKREVEAGSAHKVDWGKLMWDLVENEILELPKRDDKMSYFGVYLQSLICAQQPHLFKCREVKKVRLRGDPETVFPKRGIQMWMQQPHLVNNPSNLVESCVEAAEVDQVQQQTMDVQTSQLGITLNDDAVLDKSNRESLSSKPNAGKMHIDGYNDHTEAQQRFQQGNQQKRARNDNNCGVPTGSAIAIANSSHDIVEIERELKHATSDELGEAETFIQVVKLLQEELSAEAIMHMFD